MDKDKEEIPQSALDEAVRRALAAKENSDLEKKVEGMEKQKKMETNIQLFGAMLLLVGILLYIFFV